MADSDGDCFLPSDVDSDWDSKSTLRWDGESDAGLPPDVGSAEELMESETGGDAEASKFPCSCHKCALHFSATQVEQWRAERMALPEAERKRSNIMM